MITSIAGSAVKSVMTFHPGQTEDNSDLIFHDVSAEQLIRHTGIRYRKIAPKSWSFEQYTLKCVDRFLSLRSLNKDEIDVLVCVTQSSGSSIPSVSFFLHEKLGLSSSVCCLDVNLGCSGYVQGLQIVQSLLATSLDKEMNGLLVCGDFSSHLIDPTDQSVRPIFSDALSVTHIQSSERYREKSSTYLIETEGKGRHAIYLNESTEGKLRLNGIDVFNYSLKMVPPNLIRLKENIGEQQFNPVAILFHQANKIINDSICRKMKLEEFVVPDSLYLYGNTSSASIPLTFCNHFAGKEVKQNHLLLCGFGIGFSVASGLVLFDTSDVTQPLTLDL